MRPTLLTTAISASLLLTFSAATLEAKTLNTLPILTLPDSVQADQALNALGNRLPVWADLYDMSVDDFARTLREDENAFLDTRGRLYFIEPAAEETPTANADVYDSAPYPLEQTFQLESRPSAAITLYLDFDGHLLEGTAWNDNGSTSGTGPIAAQPWSSDSDPSTFNDSEKRDIQLIWRRVAEDFAPFDINVTTRFPGEDALIRNTSSDPYYGTRVLITPNSFYNCGCGGVAYVGTFDYVGSDYYQPALVFNGGVVGIAEAASHEAGHNLGLSHDASTTDGYYSGHGTGETSWAPIMGVGYSKNLVQWSKGEYANATQTQDDYLVMASNLLPFAPDDHGDDSETATVPLATGDGVISSFSVRGVIQQPTDIDAFQFTSGAGTLWINVAPVYASPNLDIGFELRNSAGTLIAWSSATETLATSIEVDVAADQYTLLVDGVGKGDPLATGYTDYGSVGGYRVEAQFAYGGEVVAPTAVISSDYTPGYAPLTVNTDGSQSINATGYSWRFGDGATATGVAASHTYTKPGEYNLELTVTSPDDLTGTTKQIIDVINQPPFAQASVDRLSGEAPLSVSLDAGGSFDIDGEIIQYAWDFGDGTMGLGALTNHTYTRAGEFPINLTITDDLGAQATFNVGIVSVAVPAIVESTTQAETSIAGNVVGDHLDTHLADGTSQRITERESGGKRNQRFSYAEHEWQVSLPAGESVISILGGQTPSVDGDVFDISWSDPTQNGAIGSLTTQMGWLHSSPLTHPAGTLTIHLRDSNRGAGNLSLDSALIDAISVTTDTSVDPGNTGGGGGDDGGGGDTSTGVTLTLTDAYKVKGANLVLISWDVKGNAVDVKRDGVVLTSTDAASFLDDKLGKGGMTVRYQICVIDSQECSNVLTVVF